MAKNVPAMQLAAHAKSSTLWGRKSKSFRVDGLLLLSIIIHALRAPLSKGQRYGWAGASKHINSKNYFNRPLSWISNFMWIYSLERIQPD